MQSHEPHLLKTEVIEGLSPGVRELVVWLCSEGFDTRDSGDGSNAEDGMECAVEYPMVAMLVSNRYQLVDEALRLKTVLENRGLHLDRMIERQHEDKADGSFVKTLAVPQVQATYDPHDDTAVLVLSNVLSTDVGFKAEAVMGTAPSKPGHHG